MKLMMIKKMNIIVSLWLIVIIGVLVVFGYELDMTEFYIAGGVIAAVLLLSNVFTLTTSIIVDSKKSIKTQREYTKY